MLWVYDHYKYFYSHSAGIDLRRQILTTKVDPRTVRVKARRETDSDFYSHRANIDPLYPELSALLTIIP